MGMHANTNSDAASILKFKLNKENINNNTWSNYNEAVIFSGHMIDFNKHWLILIFKVYQLSFQYIII